MKPPHPFIAWQSHHIRLVWTVVAVEMIAIFVVVLMTINVPDFWYIVGAGFFGGYLITMSLYTRLLRRVKADADYWATRRDSG